jgi:hypothetical protein
MHRHIHRDHATGWMRVMTVAFLLTSVLSARSDERRGAVAFHYGPALTAQQLEWFGGFDVLVTHDPLPRAQVATLHARGTKLALYEWSVAYYRALAPRGSWQLRAPVLNAKPLRGGVGASDADAFYYDPAAPGFARARSRALTKKLRTVHYDGVFFDTTTEQSVHPDARAEYRRRHPEVAYDEAFSRFLRELREEWKGGVILTNQAYRDAEHYLPHVDYDITESLITGPVDGVFRLRARAQIDAWMNELILPAARRYPNVRYVHLNYVSAPDRALIDEILAIAKEYGQEAYVASPDVTQTAMMPLRK